MARRTAGGSAAVPAEIRLWAPWRHPYVTAVRPRRQACIFCFGRLTSAGRRRRLVLYENPGALVMLNRYPYNNGHLLVAPRRHLASPELLTGEERARLADLIAAAVERLRARLKPAGFNVGANLGRSAGAGFASHLHWHVVPRWEGDTNFMTVLASTRVLSEHLAASFAALAPLFKTIAAQISR